MLRSEVAKIMLILKDVRVRESAIELNAFVNPLLSFPCVFQVVPDKIVAFEQVTMQDFDAIIVPLKCTETFSTSTFVEIVQSIGGRVPKIIYMVAHDDTVDTRRLDAFLRLTLENSIPLNDLVRVITSATAAHRPATVVPPPQTLAPEQNSAQSFQAQAGKRSANVKRKRECSDTVYEDTGMCGASSTSFHDYSMPPAEHDPAMAYHHYMQAVHMHQQWLHSQSMHAQDAGKRARTRPMRAAPEGRPLQALSDSTSEAAPGRADVPLVTSSSDANEEFECFLDGFDDMYSFLMEDAEQSSH